MTTDDLRAAARELVTLHERFAPLFGRKEARAQSLIYLRGLLAAQGRKSAEPMALAYGKADDDGISQNQVLALQRFLSVSPWDALDIQREIQSVFAEELMPSTAEWPLGVVGVFDSSSFPKKGSKSVGVQRQYCGRLGKKENCQLGVYLLGVAPAGCALVDHQLYLPKVWADDADRRDEAHVPKDVEFRTELTIGLDLLRRTRATDHVLFDWVVADETYGHNGNFLDGLEEMQQRYLLEVPVSTTVWIVEPPKKAPRRPCPCRQGVRTVKEMAAELPATLWRAMQIRDGAKGPLVFEFAAVRVWAVRHSKPGPPIWLVLRRGLGDDPEIKHYVSNASADTPLETLALLTGCRCRVEEFFEEGKSYLGMAHYEARAWPSWHHHMSLVALAHLFVTLTRLRLKKKCPS
jgi:SRSO17 transposase